jgi:MoxR-like ATPase
MIAATIQNTTRARYQSTCPCCKKLIAIGHPVVTTGPTYGKRARWKHEDCNNVPETATPTGPEHSEALAKRVLGLEARIVELEKNEPKQVEIVIVRPDQTKHTISGHVHPAMEEILQLAGARKNIFLPGPAGCGKSHIAKQVATALGLQFKSISCTAGMSEGQLTGRFAPMGEHGQFEYVSTDFIDCYENGGVFLLDEVDAADSNVLLLINSALANGYINIPNRPGKTRAEKHPDFICIAAANTYGTGADRQYVGRNQLDESTLDRFRIGCVPMDYDTTLEKQLCPDHKLLVRLQNYREAIRRNRINRVVSTRFIIDAYDMVSTCGWTYDRVDQALFAGWREDERIKVKGS